MSEIKKVDDVCSVVNCHGVPFLVPDEVVEVIRDMADEDGCMSSVDFTKPSHWFRGKVGSRVKIVWPNHIMDGIETCLTAVNKLDSRGEVSVFLRLLGSERGVSVPVKVVRLLAEATVG